MVTPAEIRQAQAIVFRIRGGRSIRTDPRSTVGRLVNRALQRQIDLGKSLRSALAKGLLEKEQFAKSKARAETLLAQKAKPFTPKPKLFTPRPKPKKLFTPLPEQITRIPKPKKVLRPTIIGRPIPKIIRKRIPTIKKTALKIADVVSGRAITRTNISKEQERINKRIEKFNKEFGNQNLSQKGFSAAQKQSSFIIKEQEALDKSQEEFEKSKAKKVGDFVFRTEALFPTLKEKDIPIEVEKQEKELKKLQQKESGAKGLNKKRLASLVKGKKLQISNTKKGIGGRVLAGSIPITPIGIPTGKTNLIRFVGKQKKVGDRIVTDIVFETNGKRIGFARGVSISKGKKTTTITVGRSGVQGRKFPTAKRKIGRLQTFVSAEKGVAKQRSLDIKREVKLIKGVKATVIKKNIKFLQQASAGRVASVKGSKLIRKGIKFPSGKIVKRKARGIQLDDFASISSAFTKKDLSLIIGKTITGKGAKAIFIGLIKGSSKAKKGFSVSGRQQQEFKTALNKVISATASASASSKKVKGLSAIQRNALATSLVKKDIRLKPKPVQRIALKREVITKKRFIQKQELAPTVRSKLKQRQIQRVNLKTKQIKRLSLRQKNISRQLTKSVQKLTIKQAQKLKQSQKLVQKQIQALAKQIQRIQPTFKITPIRLLRLKRKRRKIKALKRKPTKLQAFNVFARPLKKRKGQKRPSLVRVNKVPLTEQGAKDLRNYITDTSLSRTALLKPTRGKPRRSRLKVPRGFAKRTSKKFRRFRIVKGKRKLLPQGKVIEKSRHLLDTRQEKRQITLRRRIKQITPKKRKSVRRKVVKRKVRKTSKRKNIKRTKTFRRKRKR